MNAIGEKINYEEIRKQSRNLNPNELLNLLKGDVFKFWSWGAENFTIDKKDDCRMFKMTVNGHHHKGHVYIFLNGLDLFDVYLTKKDGEIVQKTSEEGLYFDQLVDWIDERVERIEAYER